jgi:hypothetical protein
MIAQACNTSFSANKCAATMLPLSWRDKDVGLSFNGRGAFDIVVMSGVVTCARCKSMILTSASNMAVMIFTTDYQMRECDIQFYVW